jgi:hypothetical protein
LYQQLLAVAVDGIERQARDKAAMDAADEENQ